MAFQHTCLSGRQCNSTEKHCLLRGSLSQSRMLGEFYLQATTAVQLRRHVCTLCTRLFHNRLLNLTNNRTTDMNTFISLQCSFSTILFHYSRLGWSYQSVTGGDKGSVSCVSQLFKSTALFTVQVPCENSAHGSSPARGALSGLFTSLYKKDNTGVSHACLSGWFNWKLKNSTCHLL